MTDRAAEHLVNFEAETHRPVRMHAGAILSEELDVTNSPMLFGCRTGICGTCLIEIMAIENGELADPSDDEMELLELIAPDNPRARLACQIELRADLKIKYIGHGS